MKHECFFFEWTTTDLDGAWVAVSICTECGELQKTYAWQPRDITLRTTFRMEDEPHAGSSHP